MDAIEEKVEREKKGKSFFKQKFYGQDFSNQDLSYADFRQATVFDCNFDNCDLSYAKFDHANCMKSSFRQAKLYRTSFASAVLARTKMDPRDMFGASVSLSCDTFDGMEIGTLWWETWMYMLYLTSNVPEPVKKSIKEAIGEKRIAALDRVFAQRSM